MTDVSTKIIHAKKPSQNPYNAVNPPIVRASTIALESMDGVIKSPHQAPEYGRQGLEPHDTFKQAVNHLESAYNTIVTNSGLEAVSMSILTNVKAGDNILMTDGLYVPSRIFCDTFLAHMGVTTTYYDPDDLSDLKTKIQKNTTLIFSEFPATTTMNMGDIDGVLAFAKKHNLISIVDNCWGAGILFRPLECGFDVSVQSATKYISGHADVMLGTIAVREKSLYDRMALKCKTLGISVSPDSVYLGLRGIRTIATRIKQHQENATIIMEWLQQNPLVKQVLSPTLSTHTGHKMWKKHYSGHNGLFSFTFIDSVSVPEIDGFVNDLTLFAIGFGWGGFESVISVVKNPPRVVKQWDRNPIIRLHIGLETPTDLIKDMQQSINKNIGPDLDN